MLFLEAIYSVEGGFQIIAKIVLTGTERSLKKCFQIIAAITGFFFQRSWDKTRDEVFYKISNTERREENATPARKFFRNYKVFNFVMRQFFKCLMQLTSQFKKRSSRIT